ncbi:5-hydroxyisourate hydrolase precursor [Pirellulimonas nuda]|uniref:5-hydroxyisourate hydrolase n=1 Tax=Pirellulimonas nuda TaxID=2528009 RepID=A0A518DH26_9BACT|nr:hydroxyisourate hydrolase [Pirellulimonas nuda]QDU90742.1 5-hydroxyisourate hydrolase precursor [Pirellulimonas nuda]
MNSITTHVLDTALGRPAAGVLVELFQWTDGAPVTLAHAHTDADGRVQGWGVDLAVGPHCYRLTFATDEYFTATGRNAFYPSVTIDFRVVDGSHYHVPLLLSPYGYSTYRGS